MDHPRGLEGDLAQGSGAPIASGWKKSRGFLMRLLIEFSVAGNASVRAHARRSRAAVRRRGRARARHVRVAVRPARIGAAPLGPEPRRARRSREAIASRAAARSWSPSTAATCSASARAYIDLDSVRYGLRCWVEDLAVEPRAPLAGSGQGAAGCRQGLGARAGRHPPGARQRARANRRAPLLRARGAERGRAPVHAGYSEGRSARATTCYDIRADDQKEKTCVQRRRRGAMSPPRAASSRTIGFHLPAGLVPPDSREPATAAGLGRDARATRDSDCSSGRDARCTADRPADRRAGGSAPGAAAGAGHRRGASLIYRRLQLLEVRRAIVIAPVAARDRPHTCIAPERGIRRAVEASGPSASSPSDAGRRRPADRRRRRDRASSGSEPARQPGLGRAPRHLAIQVELDAGEPAHVDEPDRRGRVDQLRRAALGHPGQVTRIEEVRRPASIDSSRSMRRTRTLRASRPSLDEARPSRGA